MCVTANLVISRVGYDVVNLIAFVIAFAANVFSSEFTWSNSLVTFNGGYKVEIKIVF